MKSTYVSSRRHPNKDYQNIGYVDRTDDDNEVAVCFGQNGQGLAKHIALCLNTHDELVSTLRNLLTTTENIFNQRDRLLKAQCSEYTNKPFCEHFATELAILAELDGK